MEAGRWRYSFGKREEELRPHKKNIIEHLPCARYYTRHAIYILSSPHLWRMYTQLQLRKLKFWEMFFPPPYSILGTGPTNYPALKTETGSCPWSLLSNPLNLCTLVNVGGHPHSKRGSKVQKWSGNNVHTLFAISATSSKVSHPVVLISHWPVTLLQVLTVAQIYQVHFSFILNTSSISGQGYSRPWALDSTAWHLTWMSHVHLKLTWPETKFVIFSSNAASLPFPPSQHLASSITYYSSQKPAVVFGTSLLFPIQWLSIEIVKSISTTTTFIKVFTGCQVLLWCI